MTTTESGPEASARLGEVLLEARGVSKFFPGVRALEGVDFTLRTGEVHALVGENGAGKSTLMKVLSGLYQPDEGEVLMRGEPITLPTPLAAQQAGISVIHQEFFLMNHLTAGCPAVSSTTRSSTTTLPNSWRGSGSRSTRASRWGS